MTSKKKLFENSILYTFSGILTKCINFILLPIYTAHLTTGDYGIYSLVTSFTATAFYFVSLGLETALIRFYCDYKDNKRELKRLIGTCIIAIVLSDTVFTLLCIIFKDFLCNFILEGVSFIPYIVLGLVELGCVCINTIYRTVLKASGDGKKLTITSLVMFFVSTMVTIWLVVIIKKGATGMLIAIAISRFLLLIYAIYDLIKRDLISICFDLPLLKKSLKYSLPIIPHSMSTYIATFVSKIFLNRASTISSVGIYNISTQIAAVIDTFQDSVGQAYRPWLNELLTENTEGKENQIREISETLMRIFSFIFIGIALFSYEVVALFLNESYFEAWKVIPILSVAFSLKALYYFYIYKCFYYTEIANKIFIISIFANIVNIICSYFLTPLYGMYGTAISQLLADIIRTTTTIMLANMQPKIGYRLHKLLQILLTSWIFIFVGVLPAYLMKLKGFVWWLFEFKIMLILVYIGTILYIYRETFHKMLNNFSNKNRKGN